jgi:hypothetical protein
MKAYVRQWRCSSNIPDLGTRWFLSASRSFRFNSGKNIPLRIGTEAAWASVWTLWKREKTLPLPGNRNPAAQSIARSYTECFILGFLWRKLDLFPSSGEGIRDTYAVESVIKSEPQSLDNLCSSDCNTKLTSETEIVTFALLRSSDLCLREVPNSNAAMNTNFIIFWDVMQYSLADRY